MTSDTDPCREAFEQAWSDSKNWTCTKVAAWQWWQDAYRCALTRCTQPPTEGHRQAALKAISELDNLDTYIRVVHDGKVPKFVHFIIHKIQPHLTTVKAALQSGTCAEVVAVDDMTDDDFETIFVEWKNQQGMNGFLTQMNRNHIKWVFECLQFNGLRIVKGAP